MKIVRFGKEHTRYSLIMMKKERTYPLCDAKSIDDTITYYNSDNLNKLLDMEYKLHTEIQPKVNHYIDVCIYDYKEMKYVK